MKRKKERKKGRKTERKNETQMKKNKRTYIQKQEMGKYK